MKKVIHAFRTKVLPNLKWLPESEIRKCGCCGHTTIIVALSHGEEYRLCLRCRANMRHEMIARMVKELDYRSMAILELSKRSPLQSFLRGNPRYTRSYFDQNGVLGKVDPVSNARCEDITRLTFDNESLDIMISGDVLEHVPDVHAAMRETCRVLRPGGVHLFTVPTLPSGNTIHRARIEDGRVIHMVEPQYHSDPANAQGILAFWTFGLDLPQVLATDGLSIDAAIGPVGRDNRVVWRARKNGSSSQRQ